MRSMDYDRPKTVCVCVFVCSAKYLNQRSICIMFKKCVLFGIQCERYGSHDEGTESDKSRLVETNRALFLYRMSGRIDARSENQRRGEKRSVDRIKLILTRAARQWSPGERGIQFVNVTRRPSGQYTNNTRIESVLGTMSTLFITTDGLKTRKVTEILRATFFYGDSVGVNISGLDSCTLLPPLPFQERLSSSGDRRPRDGVFSGFGSRYAADDSCSWTGSVTARDGISCFVISNGPTTRENNR